MCSIFIPVPPSICYDGLGVPEYRGYLVARLHGRLVVDLRRPALLRGRPVHDQLELELLEHLQVFVPVEAFEKRLPLRGERVNAVLHEDHRQRAVPHGKSHARAQGLEVPHGREGGTPEHNADIVTHLRLPLSRRLSACPRLRLSRRICTGSRTSPVCALPPSCAPRRCGGTAISGRP